VKRANGRIQKRKKNPSIRRDTARRSGRYGYTPSKLVSTPAKRRSEDLHGEKIPDGWSGDFEGGGRPLSKPGPTK